MPIINTSAPSNPSTPDHLPMHEKMYLQLYEKVSKCAPEAATSPIRLVIAAYVAEQHPETLSDSDTFNAVCSYTERLWLLTSSSDILFLEYCVDLYFQEPDTFTSATTSAQLFDLVDRINNML